MTQLQDQMCLSLKHKTQTNAISHDITAFNGIVFPTQFKYDQFGPLWFTHLFFKISVNVTVHHLGNIFTGFATVK